jgi:hypothetical protein
MNSSLPVMIGKHIDRSADFLIKSVCIMKKNVFRLLLLFIIVFFGSFYATAQVYVRIRPIAPVVVRTAQPSHEHVWIDEEWEPNGNGYRYTGGHWERPPHPGYHWRSGHWRRHHEDGERWVAGGWRR